MRPALATKRRRVASTRPTLQSLPEDVLDRIADFGDSQFLSRPNEDPLSVRDLMFVCGLALRKLKLRSSDAYAFENDLVSHMLRIRRDCLLRLSADGRWLGRNVLPFKLEYLSVHECGSALTANSLPSSLKTLLLHNATNLDVCSSKLPNLKNLTLRHCGIKRLSSNTLKRLVLYMCSNSEAVQLPNCLEFLTVSPADVLFQRGERKLPKTLIFLELEFSENSVVDNLPEMPLRLSHLSVSYYPGEWPALPNELVWLQTYQCRMDFKRFPISLKHVELWGQALNDDTERLPELPLKLQSLVLISLRLSEKPKRVPSKSHSFDNAFGQLGAHQKYQSVHKSARDSLNECGYETTEVWCD